VAFFPLTDKFGGWPAFVVSIVFIGALTAFIGDVAAHFGCVSRIKEQITAITIVSLGTSVPGALKILLISLKTSLKSPLLTIRTLRRHLRQ